MTKAGARHEIKAPKALPGKERKATLARKMEGNSGKGGKGDKGKSSEKGGGKNPKSNRQCWKCGNFGRHGYECRWRLRKVIGRLLFIGARTHLRHTCARRWTTSYRTGRSLYSAADQAKGNPDVGRDLRRTQCACASAWLEFDVRFYSSPPIGINFQTAREAGTRFDLHEWPCRSRLALGTCEGDRVWQADSTMLTKGVLELRDVGKILTAEPAPCGQRPPG